MSSKSLFHVIKDPVHGTMQFTDCEDRWIKPFINSPLFQRLRNIKQMGMTNLIFPGAVHTRFNHSLGCCYVANQISTKIALDDQSRQLVVLACLMHDIGHGPFSHAFEGIFTRNPIKHEDWTPNFLATYHNDEFITQYNQLNPDFPLSKEALLRVEAMIMHTEKENKLLADIVSSQLDADRLDYLLRDAHFCGVSYGEYDLRWLLHVVTRVNANGEERLGITHKGIGAVEQYLMARRLLMRNINHHQKKRAAETLLVQWLQQLAISVEDEAIFSSIKETDLGQFFINVSRYNAGTQDKKSFLTENFERYSNLFDYDVLALIRHLSKLDSDHDAVLLAKRIQARALPKTYRLTKAQMKKTKASIDIIKEKHKDSIRDWQLMLIEAPHQSYTSQDDPIWVDDGESLQPLSELSHLIGAMSDKLEYIDFLSIDHEALDTPAVKALLAEIEMTESVGV